MDSASNDAPVSTLDATDIARDEEIWSDNVQIVLIAQNTAFRIPQNVLSAASPVFADMLEISRRGGETLDGCAVVRLPSVSPVEIRPFLRELTRMGAGTQYCGSLIPCEALHRIKCTDLTSIIRMAHKYQADRMLKDALNRLIAVFDPHPFFASPHPSMHPSQWWSRIKDDIKEFECRGVTIRRQDAYEVVNIARLLHKPEMLPLSLFMCVTTDPTFLLNGVIRPDGEVERLSVEDVTRCLRAMPLLGGAYVRMVVDTYDPSYKKTFKDCEHQDGECAKKAKELLERFTKPDTPIPLSLSLFATGCLGTDGLCSQCGNAVRYRGSSMGGNMTQRLHSLFSLDEPMPMPFWPS